MTDTPTNRGGFSINDIVKLKEGEGSHDTYRVRKIDAEDGSIGVWGGSKNPDSYRSCRDFMPEDLILETRKPIITSWGRPHRNVINKQKREAKK
jgi:hypothetical protein